ncbi:MAG: RluA family pseudouridine synthase [Geminicoccaceae bacterium]|nr:RluA family pseudouridine synthase [Geminicoccaceae bacterium]
MKTDATSQAKSGAQSPSTSIRHVARGEDEGCRVDRFLGSRDDDLSRTRVQELIRGGGLRIDGQVVTEPGRRVKAGETVRLEVPPAAPLDLVPEAMPLSVLFEDEHLLVLDKPAGLVVHPAPGHDRGTLVHALLAHCGGSLSGIGGVQRPGIVHRIDKDVSGLLVIAKHDRAHVGLAGQFAVHSVERTYDALVFGVPARARDRIEAPIARHPRDRKRMAIVEGGKRAVSDYRLVAAGGGVIARVAVTLHTGRTHQIRVHMTARGHPLLGDPLYRPRHRPRLPPPLRAAVDELDRIALHAAVLGFDHPLTGERLRFESPAPAGFDRLMRLATEGAAPAPPHGTPDR